MLRWAHHESPDVRRLASEGCRPRLPWGIRLPSLEADPAEPVRRSVANNLIGTHDPCLSPANQA
jgi:3-methyladenine DNA glycosylase AlkC